MSVLVVGLSHRTAPVTVLEKAVVAGDTLTALESDVYATEQVAGCFVISTCNRVEIYAEVEKFHAGLSEICDLLVARSGLSLSRLTQYLYVHYEERAVQHLLSVACGLESMVVGESQILGQVRQALAQARKLGTLGRVLDELGAVALRAAKRAHSETGIDRAGASLVSVGIALAAAELPAVTAAAGAASRPPAGPARAARPAPAEEVLRGVQVLVVGAGPMSSLAVATADRLGAGHITVVNRTPERARRLAASVSGSTAPLAELPAAIAAADLVISCTGAEELVIGADMVQPNGRGPGTAVRARPLVLLDLALPRDVDPAVGGLPGVSLLDLESLKDSGHAAATAREEDVAAVRAIVTDELAAWVSARTAARVAPTVVALRAKAAGVVEAELARLEGRLGDLDERVRQELTLAMHRVVEKLLHAPTVRIKQLAGAPDAESYEAALRVLFDLDQATVESVIRADPSLAPGAQADSATPGDGFGAALAPFVKEAQ